MLNDRQTIAIALPGEKFSAIWMISFIQLFANLFNRFNVVPAPGYSSNVYATRARILQSVVEIDETQLPVDFMLWLDDDNTLTPAQFDRLLQDLAENPELDAVAGWCWVQPEGYGIRAIPSCGHFDGNHTKPLDLAQLGSIDGATPEGPDIIPVDYTGFPVVLFRWERLRMFSALRPFSPYLADELEMGFMSEDTGFWKRAQQAGLRLAVDRRVKVPHYKMRAAEPVTVQPVGVSVVEA